MTPRQRSARALPERRCPQRIVATTDVHSALDHAALFVSHLHALRGGALIADCGDFFEGTGYYVLGGGQAETALLTALYDVAAPGNHGYRHHLDDAALHAPRPVSPRLSARCCRAASTPASTPAQSGPSAIPAGGRPAVRSGYSTPSTRPRR